MFDEEEIVEPTEFDEGVVIPTSYEDAPQENRVLALMLGSKDGTANAKFQQMSFEGARQPLQKAYGESLLDEEAFYKAEANRLLALGDGTKAMEYVQALSTPRPTPTSNDRLETATSSGMAEIAKNLTPDQKRDLQRYVAYHDVSAVLQSFQFEGERGSANQFLRDVSGVQNVSDMLTVAPTINKLLGDSTFLTTTVTSEQAIEKLQRHIASLDPDLQAPTMTKIMTALQENMGKDDAAKFAQRMQEYQENGYDNFSSLFETLGVFDAAGLVVGTVKGIKAVTKPWVTLASVGGKEGRAEAARELVKVIKGEKSYAGAKEDAITASISARTMPDITGLSGEMQANYKREWENTIRGMRNSLYTGGTTYEEVLATVRRLETEYSPTVNTTVRESIVTPLGEVGSVRVQATYGDNLGNSFPTREAAEAFHGASITRGEVTIVPISEVVDTTKLVEELTAKVGKLQKDLTNAKKAGVTSKSKAVSGKPSNDLVGIAPGLQQKTVDAIFKGDNFSVKDADDLFKSFVPTQGDTVLWDQLKKLLPSDMSFAVQQSKIRAFYSPSANVVALSPKGVGDTRTFLHEVAHAVTARRLAQGRVGSDKTLQSIYKRGEALRTHVQAEIKKMGNLDAETIRELDYHLSNIDEFFTLPFTVNKSASAGKMMDVLSRIPYKNTTVLQYLMDLIKSVFRIDKGTAASELSGLFEEIVLNPMRTSLTSADPSVAGLFNESVLPGVAFGASTGVDAAKVAKKEARVQAIESALISATEDLEKAKILGSTPKEGWVVKQTIDYPVFQGDIGTMTTTDVDTLTNILGSVNPRLVAEKNIYTDALASMLKGFKASKMYSEFVSESWNKLSKVEASAVEDVIKHGDSLPEPRDFSPAELTSFGLNDQQVDAYLRYRGMRELLWQHKEEAFARNLMSKGYRFGYFKMEFEGAEVAVNGPALRKSVADFNGKRVFDPATGRAVQITDDLIKTSGDKVVLEFMQAQEVGGKQLTRFLLPKDGFKFGDIRQSIGYVPGSYSRVYTDEFWIKWKGQVDVDGEMKDFSKAFRTASSQKQATAYIAGMNKLLDIRKGGNDVTPQDVTNILGKGEESPDELATLLNEGKYDNMTLEWNYNRLDDNYLRSTTGTGDPDITSGQTFWSQRGEKAIRSISTQGSAIENPLKALEMELNNVARYTSAHEWRTNAIQRWFNTFQDIIADKELGDAEETFFRFTNRDPVNVSTDPRYNDMRNQHAFILAQISQRTYDEKKFDQWVFKTLANLGDNPFFEKLGAIPVFSRFPHLVRNMGVADFMKSTASTMLLGVFNVSQILVQASGAAMAVAVSPGNGLKAITMANALRRAALSDNPEVWRMLSKATGVDVADAEFERTMRALQRTGLIDRVRSASSYGNVFDGSSLSKQNWFAQHQMMFFNAGEELAKVTAFDIARRDFIKEFPDAVWDNNENLRAILLRADDITSNMNAANKSRWTKGFAGIPLQFLTYSINQGTSFVNSAASLVTGKRTILRPRDVAKMYIAGHLLFGSSNMALPDVVETWMGENMSDLPPEMKVAITQGLPAAMLDALSQATTGQELKLAIGSRLTPVQWYEDVFDWVVSGADASLLEEAMGPSGAFFRALGNGMDHVKALYHQEHITGSELVRRTGSILSGFASSLNNAEKAYYAYQLQGQLYSKRGDLQDTMTTMELVSKALGVNTIEAAESSQTFKLKQSHKEYIRKTGDTIAGYMQAAQRAYVSGDMEGYRANHEAASGIFYSHRYNDMKELRQYMFTKPGFGSEIVEYATKNMRGLTGREDKLFVNDPFNLEE